MGIPRKVILYTPGMEFTNGKGERGRKVSGEEDAYQPYLQEERRYAAKGLISFQFV